MSHDEVRYQVFVSSTFVDLKEEREKVLQAILEQRAFPAGMELFPSADEEQFEFIKREIDSSDYYILIIAGRYGSVAPDGLSYTEKEYDYAIKQGKPVLSFLHHDIERLPGEKLERTDHAQELLKAFRTKAKRNRLVSLYQNSDDLKAKVLTSLSSQFQLTPKRGWVRSGQTPREVLENILELQQKIIELERENSRLKALETPIAHLASGAETVTWTLNIQSLVPDAEEPMLVRLSRTWDELLIVAFSGGSSYANDERLRTSIGRTVADEITATWEESRTLAAINNLTHAAHIIRPIIDPILRDMHRQFSGLGLIEEVRETAYQSVLGPSYGKPYIQRLWKLTSAGQTYIALIRGYLKGSSKVTEV